MIQVHCIHAGLPFYVPGKTRPAAVFQIYQGNVPVLVPEFIVRYENVPSCTYENIPVSTILPRVAFISFYSGVKELQEIIANNSTNNRSIFLIIVAFIKLDCYTWFNLTMTPILGNIVIILGKVKTCNISCSYHAGYYKCFNY